MTLWTFENVLGRTRPALEARVNKFYCDYDRFLNTDVIPMQTMCPFIVVDGAAKAIEFYKTVFGAVELYRLVYSGGDRIGYAELMIKDGYLMLSDEMPGGMKNPLSLGGTPVRLSLLVDDVDATFEIALQNGATALNPPQNQFYGFRSASFRDPFGHEWLCGKEIEKVTPEEMQRRLNEMMG